ncbi:hypothetical protein KEJ15_09230 [Candidatus Bathyarchaeota archaeon]|nr:hypothetical protein [Candidatus Bathyarchaeota archaeon]
MEQAQKIIDRILQDANDKAKTIVEEAQKSAKTLLENRRELARKKAAEDERSLLKKSQTQIKTIRGRAITEAKRKADWLVLSEKERLITKVLDEVKSRLVALSKSKEYTPILERFIIEAGVALNGGELEVALGDDGSLLSSLKTKGLSDAIAEKTGVKTTVRLSKDKISSAGVIVKTTDGKIVLDNTFEAILKRREKELRLKTAKILFGS